MTPEERRGAIAAGRVIVDDLREAAGGVNDDAMTAAQALLAFAAVLERRLNQAEMS